MNKKALYVAALAALISNQIVASEAHHMSDIDKSTNGGFETIKLGANLDLLMAIKDFGPEDEQVGLTLREVELSLEAQINPWLQGVIFLTKPSDEPFDVEEAAVIADLGNDIRLKAGKYRNEFGLLNTVHEPERLQATLPLPVIEFLGEEQLREPSIMIGKKSDLEMVIMLA